MDEKSIVMASLVGVYCLEKRVNQIINFDTRRRLGMHVSIIQAVVTNKLKLGLYEYLNQHTNRVWHPQCYSCNQNRENYSYLTLQIARLHTYT